MGVKLDILDGWSWLLDETVVCVAGDACLTTFDAHTTVTDTRTSLYLKNGQDDDTPNTYEACGKLAMWQEQGKLHGIDHSIPSSS